MTENPLNVQVAEALGWEGCHETSMKWWGLKPHGTYISSPIAGIPPYGEDSPEGWACTGPLLQRFKLDLERAEDTTGKDLEYWLATHIEGTETPRTFHLRSNPMRSHRTLHHRTERKPMKIEVGLPQAKHTYNAPELSMYCSYEGNLEVRSKAGDTQSTVAVYSSGSWLYWRIVTD